MTLRLETLCGGCVHYRVAKSRSAPPTCAAFPDGIPEEIEPGGYVHRNEYPGDHGIHFEPIAYGGIGARVVEGYESWAHLRGPTSRASGAAPP